MQGLEWPRHLLDRTCKQPLLFDKLEPSIALLIPQGQPSAKSYFYLHQPSKVKGWYLQLLGSLLISILSAGIVLILDNKSRQ